MTRRDHIVVLHRWRARYAEYERYLDHENHAVTYVSTEVGASSVPASAAEVTVVPATDDLPAVADEVKRLVERHGPPAGIVALKEDDLLVAAQLRAEWDCPGPTVTELTPFRDKLIMTEAVSAAGLAAPPLAAAPDTGSVTRFAERHGWPVIVKPRVGSASEGVSRVESAADLLAVDFESGGPLLVQAFDSRQIYHVDGYFDGGELGPYRVSRYLNTCLDFRSGAILGSVTEDDRDVVDAVGRFTTRALAALSSGPLVFHLEVFADPGDGSVAFLEVGARVSGAEIPFLWREVYGLDLMELGFALALGGAPRPVPAGPATDVAGYLLVPAPATRPCRITEVTSMSGRVPGLYAEQLLRRGDVLPAADSYYEHVGGRFRFRGATTDEVVAAITATARDFRVRAEAVTARR